MKLQEILIVSTPSDSPRSMCLGWTYESGVLALESMMERGHGCDVGFIRGHAPIGGNTPKTPLHVLGMGWHLITPPQRVGTDWEWWFSREIDVEA